MYDGFSEANMYEFYLSFNHINQSKQLIVSIDQSVKSINHINLSGQSIITKHRTSIKFVYQSFGFLRNVTCPTRCVIFS